MPRGFTYGRVPRRWCDNDEDFSEFMAYFKHDKAIVESESIGDGTRVWANAHILAGATGGRDCHKFGRRLREGDGEAGGRRHIKKRDQLGTGNRTVGDVVMGADTPRFIDPYPPTDTY